MAETQTFLPNGKMAGMEHQRQVRESGEEYDRREEKEEQEEREDPEDLEGHEEIDRTLDAVGPRLDRKSVV